MQRNYRSLLVGCTVIAALLSGCAGGHTHQTSGAWETDLAEHWQICADCGEEVEKGAHTMDDSDTCTVCGTQVVDWGDSKSLYQFSESGDPLRFTDYDADGNVLTETIYEYEYDADGNLLRSSTVTDGVLTDESAYATVNGERVVCEYISYLEDGSKSVGYYDENGNITRSVFYDAEGNVDLQTDSEYALSAEGEWYEAVCTTTEADGSRYISEFSENGDQTGAAYYDAEGTLVYRENWVYTYTEDGNWQTMAHYFDDVLTGDTVYATVTTEDGSMTYPETVTEYGEDGTKTVTVYNENDEIVSQTHYDANGAVIA